MEKVIKLVTDGAVSPEDIMDWINGENKSAVLRTDYASSDFIPAFLNFIYDQTSRALQITNNCTVSPIKHLNGMTKKYISPCKSKTHIHKTGKAKTLDFSADAFMVEKNDSISFKDSSTSLSLKSPNKQNLEAGEYLPMIDVCQTPVKKSSFIQTSTPKIVPRIPLQTPSPIQSTDHKSINLFSSVRKSIKSPHSFSESVKNIAKDSGPKHTRKIEFHKRPRTHNLSDFIVFDKKQNKKGKCAGNWTPITNRDENVINIADNEEFPPVGAELQLKDKKKRIKPTLVSNTIANRGFMKKTPLVMAQQSNQNAFQVPEQTDEQWLTIERNLLKIEREKFLRTDTTPSKAFNVDSQSKISFQSSSIPCIDAVIHKEKLTALAKLYALFIMNNLVPNITTELFYIFKLLVIDSSSLGGSADTEKNFFLVSVHNAVYFSVQTLRHLTELLALFDRITLKLLSENSRIALFCSDLNTKLIELGETSLPLRIAKGPPKSPILSVSFQSETDNRNNFSSTAAFQVFRKQRDLFYEVIRVWEDYHLNTSWSFSKSVGNKIQQIMTLRSDPTNYAHFSRLFQSQLLTMCIGDDQTNNLADFEEVSCLLQLRQSHPERFKRLHERLITPFKVGKPVPLPSFPGYQEFFKNFILEAKNHAFYCHLRDCFTAMLQRLQSSVCGAIDEDEIENHEDHLRNETLTVLQSLKLIAKFIGLVEFIPYQTSEVLTETVIASHVELRNSMCPALPLSRILRQACVNGCLVVTIPWMVDLLSMADAVAFHTENYLTLSFLLIAIYKMMPLFRTANISKAVKCAACLKHPQYQSSSQDFNLVNSLYLKVLLGWLFSLPQFPEGLFYTSATDVEIDREEATNTLNAIGRTYRRSCYGCFTLGERQGICSAESSYSVTPSKGKLPSDMLAVTASSPLHTPSKDFLVGMLDTPGKTPMKKKPVEPQPPSIVLDSWNLLDHQTLLFSCPYLAELKNLLSEFTFEGARSKSTSGIRKITPLTTTEAPPSAKLIQIQLEENFFHNQPTSVKKTIDFTVERIFSNTLKYGRNELVPKLRESCLKELKTSVTESTNWSEMEELHIICENLAQQKSEFIIGEIRLKVHEKVSFFIEEKTLSAALMALLPTEVTDECFSICCQVARRSVLEKVNHWLGNQLVPDFCRKEFEVATKKAAKQVVTKKNSTILSEQSSINQSSMMESLSETLNNSTAMLLKKEIPAAADSSFALPEIHNTAAPVPSELLSNLKMSMRKLFSSRESDCVTAPEMHSLMKDVQMTLNERRDMTAPLLKAIKLVYAEWLAALCVVTPDLMDEDVVSKMLCFWSNADGTIEPHNNLLCLLAPKTLRLLGEQPETVQVKAWPKIRFVLMKMLNATLIGVQNLHEAIMILLRYTWPQKTLSEISSLINIVTGHGQPSRQDVVQSQLLDWVSWVCSEMEIVD